MRGKKQLPMSGKLLPFERNPMDPKDLDEKKQLISDVLSQLIKLTSDASEISRSNIGLENETRELPEQRDDGTPRVWKEIEPTGWKSANINIRWKSGGA